MACTGIEFCKLALVETKARARTVVAELERRPFYFDAVLHPRQRLPQLLRPDPGRRRRPQGHGAEGRRRRACRGLPGASRWEPRQRPGTRPQDTRPQGARRDLPDYVERLAGRYPSSASRRSPCGLGLPCRRRGGPLRAARRPRSSTARSAPRRTCVPRRSRPAPGLQPARVFTVGLVTSTTTQIPGRLAEQERIEEDSDEPDHHDAPSRNAGELTHLVEDGARRVAAVSLVADGEQAAYELRVEAAREALRCPRDLWRQAHRGQLDGRRGARAPCRHHHPRGGRVLPRHRLPLRRDARDQGRVRRDAAHHAPHHPAAPDRGGAGRPARPAPARPQPRPVARCARWSRSSAPCRPRTPG